MVSLKNLPGEVNRNYLVVQIKKNYGTLTLAELELAFSIGVSRKLEGVDPDSHYNDLSYKYVSAFLAAYEKLKSRVLMQKSTVQKEESTSDKEIKKRNQECVQAAFEKFCKGENPSIPFFSIYEEIKTLFAPYMRNGEFPKDEIWKKANAQVTALKEKQQRQKQEGWINSAVTEIIVPKDATGIAKALSAEWLFQKKKEEGVINLFDQ